jgi:hypothetical protein
MANFADNVHPNIDLQKWGNSEWQEKSLIRMLGELSKCPSLLQIVPGNRRLSPTFRLGPAQKG